MTLVLWVGGRGFVWGEGRGGGRGEERDWCCSPFSTGFEDDVMKYNQGLGKNGRAGCSRARKGREHWLELRHEWEMESKGWGCWGLEKVKAQER